MPPVGGELKLNCDASVRLVTGEAGGLLYVMPQCSVDGCLLRVAEMLECGHCRGLGADS